MHKLMSTVAAGAVAGFLALGTGFASTGAAAAPAGEDQTRVAVKPSLARTLTAADISATPINGADAGAFRGTVALRFDISGTPGAVIRHSGGVVLTSHAARLSLRRLWVDTRKGEVTALVNGTDRVRVFTVEAPSRRPKLGQLRLNLTGVAANALNATFGTDLDRQDTFGFASVLDR
jgi:hypothetical protein